MISVKGPRLFFIYALTLKFGQGNKFVTY